MIILTGDPLNLSTFNLWPLSANNSLPLRNLTHPEIIVMYVVEQGKAKVFKARKYFIERMFGLIIN